MATIAQNLQILIDTKNDIKDAIEEKGVDLTNIPFTDYHLKIAEIQGGGGEIIDTAINILLGHTLPIATKNGGETFFLEHSSGVSITGLDNYATITGNGTQRVEWTLTENGDTDLIIPYVITLGNGDNVIGRQFYYGKETSDWVVLATLYRPNTGEAGNFTDNWVLIESSSAPTFSSETTLYNGVYSHQAVSVRASKTATSVSGFFLSSCYSFNQPLDTSNLTSVGDYFLYQCYSFNQPLDTSNLTSVGSSFLYYCYALTDLEWNCSVYPTDNNSLSQDIHTKTLASGTGIKITGTNAQGLINALPDRTSKPYRKLILGGE